MKKKPQWDGKSRVSNEIYRKRFNEIFNKKEETPEDDEPKTRLEQMAKLKYDPVVD